MPATVDVTPYKVSGRRAWLIEVVETATDDDDEWNTATDDGLPRIFTMTSFESTLVSGTGTTIQPRLGNATGWTDDTQAHIATQSAAAAHVNDQALVRHTIPSDQVPQIFGVSQCDAGADNVVHTRITLVEGHVQ